jgi:anaerobic magnesium-protoporphyrin IX monomethyl ester cyclase
MKLAGCEQIQFGVESGSEQVLERYRKGITVQQVQEAARIARRVGLYVFYYLMAGMEGEKLADVRKTISLIRQTLPGDGIVSPVALYPGTSIYEDQKRAGAIDDGIWSARGESGIFLRDDADVAKWISMLLAELGVVREHSWYREKDFRLHRRIAGPECWVTDILEGDYYRDNERFQEAEASYLRVAGRYTDNPWGFLRLGKIFFYMGEFEQAAEYYTRVTSIVPRYYGGWLKRAESLLALKKREEAKLCAEEAFARNPHDFRVKNILEILKKKAT